MTVKKNDKSVNLGNEKLWMVPSRMISCQLHQEPVTFTVIFRYLGKAHKSISSRETSFGRLGEGVLPCDVSLTPKKYRFFTVDNVLLARA